MTRLVPSTFYRSFFIRKTARTKGKSARVESVDLSIAKPIASHGDVGEPAAAVSRRLSYHLVVPRRCALGAWPRHRHHTHHRCDTSSRDGCDGVPRDDPRGALGAGCDCHARDARPDRERGVPGDARTIRRREPPLERLSADRNTRGASASRLERSPPAAAWRFPRPRRTSPPRTSPTRRPRRRLRVTTRTSRPLRARTSRT